MSSTN